MLNVVDATQDNNDQWTSSQKLAIRKLIPEIGEYIKTQFAPIDSRLDNMERQLSYLVESSDRVGRKDWILIAISVVTNIVSGLALEPAKASLVFNFSSGIFWQIIKGIAELPDNLKAIFGHAA